MWAAHLLLLILILQKHDFDVSLRVLKFTLQMNSPNSKNFADLGELVDRSNRADLNNASVEYIAPPDYMVKANMFLCHYESHRFNIS